MGLYRAQQSSITPAAAMRHRARSATSCIRATGCLISLRGNSKSNRTRRTGGKLSRPTQSILQDISLELGAAENANGPMINLHEAYGVIAEEFREFETEVFKNPRKHPDRNDTARKELIQVAAMCVRA